MKQLKEDFEFVLQLAKDFFSQDEIVQKLRKFRNQKCEIKGWEIWFQVEFALFLQDHAQVSEVEREKKFQMDMRKSKEKTSCSIDFFIRQKHKQSFIPLELKQDAAAAACIRHMLRDIHKFNKIRNTTMSTGRSLWCLGVHEHVGDDYMARLIHENQYFQLDPRFVITIPIQDTDFSFTVF